MPVIYSTLTADQYYILPKPPIQNAKSVTKPVADFAFLVKGGANLTDRRLVTPLGVATQCTDEELEKLKQVKAFANHMAGGYIKVEAKERSVDAAAKDMTPKDQSAPNNAEEIKKKGKANGVKSDAIKITNNKPKPE